jgi:hypothetical protein
MQKNVDTWAWIVLYTIVMDEGQPTSVDPFALNA